MKGFWIGFGAGACVGFFVLTVVVMLFAAFNNVSVVGNGHGGTIEETNSAAGLSVKFGGEHGHSVIFSRGGETYTFTSPANEQCFQTIESVDGKTVLLLMRKEMNFGYDHACLMRFDFTNKVFANTEPERILSESQLNYLLGSSGAWINDLYKISPSADRVLLDVSMNTNSSAAYRVFRKHALWYNFKTEAFEEP